DAGVALRATLELWLRGDGALDIEDGGYVRVWHDASGNNRDAAQISDIKRPQFMAGSALPGTGAALSWVQFSPGTGLGHTYGQDLDVDLTFMIGTNYTIIALVSRYGDTWPNGQEGNYFIGAGVVDAS